MKTILHKLGALLVMLIITLALTQTRAQAQDSPVQTNRFALATNVCLGGATTTLTSDWQWIKADSGFSLFISGAGTNSAATNTLTLKLQVCNDTNRPTTTTPLVGSVTFPSSGAVLDFLTWGPGTGTSNVVNHARYVRIATGTTVAGQGVTNLAVEISRNKE
jgi:hypothetical protein